MRIRSAVPEDLEAICRIEEACFGRSGRESKRNLKERLRLSPGHFWVMEEEETGRIVSMLYGMSAPISSLYHEEFMYPYVHDEEADWDLIVIAATLPGYRGRGYAGELLARAIRSARERGKRGLAGVCREGMVPYYEAFGFTDRGPYDHRKGEKIHWHELRLLLPEEDEEDIP